MEEIFQLLWSHRMLGLPLTLVSGERVRVIDPGILNRDAGPDFFNAKVRISDSLWVGNIEIHLKASDWYRHGHDSDPAYDNVILHVVSVSDTEISRPSGFKIPQMAISLPQNFYRTFGYLTSTVPEIRCASRLDHIPSIVRADWLESLAVERIQQKAARIEESLRSNHGDWNATCFMALARGFGFGLNSLPFEMLAKSISLNHLRRHSDNILQMEAIFFGQAGLLDCSLYPEDMRYQLMCREYQFLSRKYEMHPIPRVSWKFSKTRPQNFPYRRIALLAKAMAETPDLLNRIVSADCDIDRLRTIFRWHVDSYWSRRLTFGGDNQTDVRPPMLSDSSINILLINVVAPLVYAYAVRHSDYDMKEAAFNLLTCLPPERNSYVRAWLPFGFQPKDASHSQALLQLRKEYCDRHECLRCRFGHNILKSEILKF
ncbi:MAG: DUF2851 family protein [Muribaculum sp.]|nr:DUF2851 family protein [Muribaculum sp.]